MAVEAEGCRIICSERCQMLWGASRRSLKAVCKDESVFVSHESLGLETCNG